MSFLIDLAAGLSQGLGKGLIDEASYQDKVDAQMELVRERARQAAEAQRQRAADAADRDAQRAADRAEREAYNIALRAELKGANGGAGGGKGINFFEMLMAARTPEEQDRVVRLARTAAGDDAADNVASTMFGRPRMTPGEGIDATGGAETEVKSSPALFSRQKGMQALNRFYTIALDPGKFDDFSKGEREAFRNDVGARVFGETLRDGGDTTEAADAFNNVTEPKNSIQQQRIDATRDRTDAIVGGTGARIDAAKERQLRDLISRKEKLLTETYIAADKQKLMTEIGELKAMLPDAPRVSSSPSPAPSAGGSPKSRADAFERRLAETPGVRR